MAGNDGPQSLRELLTTIVGTIRDTNLAVGELRSKVESSMARTEAREERVRDEIKVLFAKQRETGEIVTAIKLDYVPRPALGDCQTRHARERSEDQKAQETCRMLHLKERTEDLKSLTDRGVLVLERSEEDRATIADLQKNVTKINVQIARWGGVIAAGVVVAELIARAWKG